MFDWESDPLITRPLRERLTRPVLGAIVLTAVMLASWGFIELASRHGWWKTTAVIVISFVGFALAGWMAQEQQEHES